MKRLSPTPLASCSRQPAASACGSRLICFPRPFVPGRRAAPGPRNGSGSGGSRRPQWSGFPAKLGFLFKSLPLMHIWRGRHFSFSFSHSVREAGIVACFRQSLLPSCCPPQCHVCAPAAPYVHVSYTIKPVVSWYDPVCSLKFRFHLVALCTGSSSFPLLTLFNSFFYPNMTVVQAGVFS